MATATPIQASGPEIPRERLVRRAQVALHSRLVLLAAPSGSGKSWLLRRLAGLESRPLVRVRLDHRSTDSAFFFWQLWTALGLADGALEPGRETPIERVATLLAALRERPPLVLALDDAEVLAESPPVLDVVRRIAERLPLGATLVAASRVALPLCVPALDERGETVSIGPEDFALGDREASELVARLAPGREIAPHELDLVRRRGEGELLTLWLFGVAARGTPPDVLARSVLEAQRPLAPLVAGALRELGEPDAAWLEAAAVLDDLRPETAEAVAGGPGRAAQAVSRAAALHLVESYETPPRVPSAVLAELRARVRADEPRWRALHARAAAALHASDPERAFHHLLEAGRVEEAVHTLITVGHAFIHFGRIAEIERLLRALSGAEIERNPLLRFIRGTLGIIRMRVVEAVDDLVAVAEAAEAADQDALANAARARLAFTEIFRGDFERAVAHAERVVARSPDCRDSVVLQAHALLELALHYLGREEEARTVRARLDAADVPYPERATLLSTRAFCARLRGDHAAQRRFAIEGIEGGRAAHAPGVMCFLPMHVAEPEIEAGRPEVGLDIAGEAADASRSMNETWFEIVSEAVRLRAFVELRDFEAAGRLGQELTRRCREIGELRWTETEVWLALCEVPGWDRSEALANAARAASRTTHPALRARVALEQARAALEERDGASAAAHLARARSELGAVDAPPERAALCVLEARAALLAGARDRARESLEREPVDDRALRRDRAALLPVLVPMALADHRWARAQVVAAGPQALALLPRRRGRRVESLRDEILERAAGPLDVSLLGPPEVLRRALREAVAFRTPRVAQLFHLLCLQTGSAVPTPRDRLFDDLWPGIDPDRAARSLNTHLSYLRRALEPHLRPGMGSRYLRREGEGYRLGLRGGQLDVARFEAAAKEGLAAEQRGDWRRAERLLSEATALYRGPLLGDHPYLDAFAEARERAQERFTRASLAAAHVARELGDELQARDRLEALLSHEPAAEEAYAALLELYAGMGRRELAAQVWRRCRAALRRHLDVPPSDELAALAGRLLGGAAAAG